MRLSKKSILSSIILVSSLLSPSISLSTITSQQKKDIHCLAQTIHHEARGESIKGQKAVASVVMNRVRSERYPKAVCGVIRQSNQFSWVGKVKTLKKIDPDIISLAQNYVLNYNPNKMDVTGGATFFHSVRVNPNWKYKKTTRIGNHVFYKHKTNAKK